MTGRLRQQFTRMQEAAQQAMFYIEGMDEATFLADRRTQDATMMQIIVIGEAVTNLWKRDRKFLARYPDIPWAGIAAMRHLTAHHYAKVHIPSLWVTLSDSVPDLLSRLPAIMMDADRHENS